MIIIYMIVYDRQTYEEFRDVVLSFVDELQRLGRFAKFTLLKKEENNEY